MSNKGMWLNATSLSNVDKQNYLQKLKRQVNCKLVTQHHARVLNPGRLEESWPEKDKAQSTYNRTRNMELQNFLILVRYFVKYMPANVYICVNSWI